MRLNYPRYLRGFSLAEVMAALVILALICTGVVIVINRCMASTADTTLQMQAFEVARERLEFINSIRWATYGIEYGSSEKYPEIKWKTEIETVNDPLASRTWACAVCSAEYTDSEGQLQTIELRHWLSAVPEDMLKQINNQKEEQYNEEEIIETVEDAADYAGVDVETIQQWVENGMHLTADGYYIKDELDLYEQTNGNPTIADRIKFIEEKEPAEEVSSEETPEDQEKRSAYKPEELESEEPDYD